MIRRRQTTLNDRFWHSRWIFVGLVFFVCSELETAAQEKPAPEIPAKEPTDAQQKALRNLFRDLFIRPPVAQPGNRRQRQGDSPESLFANGRDPIDSRAPRDSRSEQLWDAAKDAQKEKNWKQAIELYQRLLDQPDDSLHRTAEGRWQSTRQSVNEALSGLPEATIAEYRSQYGGLAQQQLAAARQSGNITDFVAVATRFFHTSAGQDAAQYVAAHHFDKSEFALAARWYAELAASSSSITRHDCWLLQAAYSFQRAGEQQRATALLQQLSQGPETLVALGSEKRNASEWIRQANENAPAPAKALTDWTQIYGSASRTGTAVGGDPLLSPNWSIPLTSSYSLRNWLKWLAHDLQEPQRALVMAPQPLLIDGKALYRDLHGLRCIDLVTGRTLWEGVEGVSPERILSGNQLQQSDQGDGWQQQNEGWRFRFNPFPNLNDYQGMSAEYSPLTSLLSRDGTYGLISSDGKQVFVIEDHGILSTKQPGQQWGWDGSTDAFDLYGIPWKTNRLVSYDLHTGRALWSVGGPESHESFDLPLAGSYLYGTPAVEGNELFLVAGKGEDIRLWSLDRLTGEPRWSQMIAYSDTKIDVDVVRRWVTSQVAVGQGIVVCPTTVGWLVAIDRMRQSLLWAYRYSPRGAHQNTDKENGSLLLPQQELNGNWCPSAPIISGNRVVFSPQDEQVLVCLNLVDGTLAWEKPKDHGLYIAGIFQELVVIVGESNVTALKLASGETAWVANIDASLRPSGRAVVVEDRLYLPLSSGELRVLKLGSGEIASQSYVGIHEPALGNLAMHRGKLVSLGITGMTGFGQKDAINEEIARRLANNPNDAWALLRSSEIQILNRKQIDAIPLLRRIDVNQLSPYERVRQHTAMIESLATVIRSDITQHSADLDELGKLVSSPAEKLLFHQLTSEKLLAEGKSVEAFNALVQLAQNSDDQFVTHPDDRGLSVRPAIWLGIRMSEIWSQASEETRKSLDQGIESVIAAESERNREACQRVADLFAFHPTGVKARERLIEWLVQSNDLAGARLEIERLIQHPQSEVAGRATERMARLMTESQRSLDAIYYYRQLESRFADAPIRDGQTGTQIVAKIREAGQLDFEPRSIGARWKPKPMKLEQSVSQYVQQSIEIVRDTDLPFFSQYATEFYQNEQRIGFESIGSGQIDWMVPLRSAFRVADDGVLSANYVGHQMYFINRGILHAISPLEKRVLWTKSVEHQIDAASHFRHDGRVIATPMAAPSRDDAPQSLLLHRHLAAGNLTAVQAGYLCLYGRRSLTVLDPRTGQEQWSREGLPINAQVFGNRDYLFVMVPGKNDAVAYRVTDGKLLDAPGLGKSLSTALLVHGSSLLLFEQVGSSPLVTLGIRPSKSVKFELKLFDPVSRTTTWQLTLPAGSVVSPLGHDEVVVAGGDGLVQRIDVATGQASILDTSQGPASMKKFSATQEKYLLADDDRIYLVVNQLDHRNLSYGESLQSIRANGTIYAWSRHDNQYLWSQSIDQQNLVVDRFATLPIMLFVSRSWRAKARMEIGTLNIVAIHKQTGQRLFDSKVSSIYNGFHALSINNEAQSVELKSYNGRLKLSPADDPSGAPRE